ILNNFDIPVGVEYTYKHEVPELPSATQWTTVIDQNRRLLFYKTMNDSTVKLIDLGNIRFTQEKENHYPLDNGVFSFQRTVID
ncbi:TPA: choloylglycine hydrolase, partial [Escherichia coli]|nr:choloylglycine hydrolase [Escherichia coli]